MVIERGLIKKNEERCRCKVREHTTRHILNFVYAPISFRTAIDFNGSRRSELDK
jgi:hypothetical protein